MRMARVAIMALMLLTGAGAARGEPADSERAHDHPAAGPWPPATPTPEPRPAGGTDVRQSVCLMIEASARAHNLPLEFFARVIWQESRFQPEVVGPRTRSGDRAQGIAQFMPRTAAERGLLDPFDPVQALPKSAEFLRELATSSAISGSPPPPIMPVRNACATGWPVPASCPPRRATMCSRSPASRSTNGRERRARAGAARQPNAGS